MSDPDSIVRDVGIQTSDLPMVMADRDVMVRVVNSVSPMPQYDDNDDDELQGYVVIYSPQVFIQWPVKV